MNIEKTKTLVNFISFQNVPGRPIISNCGTPMGKYSEFSDCQLKLLLQSLWSYIKDL